MSFWRNFGFYSISSIDNLLDRGDYTLDELLDEEEILQEVKAQNKRLLEYLIQPDQLNKLFEYITVEPAEDAETKRKFKYPFVSCEILASEVWTIVDAVYKSEELIGRLFNYLDKDPPLNPLLASFVSRVAAVLLEKKPSQMVEYLKKKDKMIDKFLKHLSSASVMELLLKVVAAEDLCENGGILQWLRESHLIKNLVTKFDNSFDGETHDNAAQALVDIIRASAGKQSPLMDELESEETLNSLFNCILQDNAKSTLLNGLTVIIELLKRNAKPALNREIKLDDLPSIYKLSLKNLDKFKDVLSPKDSAEKMFTTIGEIEPLGFVRLKVLEFFLALVQSNYECIDTVLIQKDALSRCFELFFRYQWNNFLHSLIERMVKTIFLGSDDNLKEAVITKVKLVDMILDAEVKNGIESSKPKGVRRGYMGHLILIAATIQDEAACCDQVAKALEGVNGWKDYSENTLREARMLDGKPLGGNKTGGGSLTSNSPPTSDEEYDDDDDQEDPELDFANDDDLVLRDATTEGEHHDGEHHADQGFKNIDQNSHDSDEEDDDGNKKETENAPQLMVDDNESNSTNQTGNKPAESPPSPMDTD